jgi:hypothetical protein
MIAAGVAIHLLLVVGSALDKASGESSPGLVPVSTAAASSGVVVLLGGAVGMLPAWSVFRVKTFLRFFGGATMAGAASFPSWRRRFGRLVTSLAVWLVGCWMVGLLVRSLVFFLLLFCFSFASLQGLEFKHSVVIVGRICPLVDVEAGFIILN